MSFVRSWRDYRRFNRLSPDDRSIVFYSESGQDWHHLEPIIRCLTGDLSRSVCYLTSDRDDPGLLRRDDRVLPFYVREGLLRILLFQMLRADVMVLTMMDLHNFQLKRSVHPVHYVYVFHSLGSTHMVDREDSYDHYDTILCAGPHQMEEIRRREEVKRLPPKRLVEHGYARLEILMAEGAFRPRPAGAGDPHTLLVAPTWGEHSLLGVCGEALVSVLLEAGYHVILRPHYQTLKLTPQVVERITKRFGGHPLFESVTLMGETESLYRSDLLICDWSGTAIEYALGLERPVLFIDLPPRVRNPEYRELGIEPVEVTIRSEVGAALPPDRLAEAPREIGRLLGDRERIARKAAELRRRWVFNLGRSAAAGAAEIARIADQQASRRRERVHEVAG